jgi:ADP-heptose:LPS heptosyltransferase
MANHQDASPAKVLVLRFSSIGDIVLTTPVVRRLATGIHGKTEVHYLTKARYAKVLEGNPYIHTVHTFEKEVDEIMPTLKKCGFDCIIDLHHNVRSFRVKKQLGVTAFTFSKLNLRKWLWVQTGINTMPAMHVVDRYLHAIDHLHTQDDGKGLDYFIPSETTLDLPADFPKQYVAVVLGAAHAGKRMSPQKAAEWLKEVPYPILFIGGADDQRDAAIIEAAHTGVHFNAVGQWTLHQSALALRDATVVVTGDTGMMHIASAFQKRIVSLWGCTVPGFGMAPYRPDVHSMILEPTGRKKRPCSKLGNRCKYGMQHKCIDQIEPRRIAASVIHCWQTPE